MSGSRSDTVGDAKLCVISRLPSSVQFALSTYTHTLQPRTRTVSLYANVPLCIHHDSYTFVIRYLRILHFLSTLPCFPSHFLLYNCSDKRKQRRMFHQLGSIAFPLEASRLARIVLFCLHLARERDSFLPAAIQHPSCHTIFSSSPRSDRNRQACNYIVIYAHLRMHRVYREPCLWPFHHLTFFTAPSAAIFFFFFSSWWHHIRATNYSSNRIEKIIKDSTILSSRQLIISRSFRKIYLHRFQRIINAIVIRYMSGIIP